VLLASESKAPGVVDRVPGGLDILAASPMSSMARS
jgi:hypothetical protein